MSAVEQMKEKLGSSLCLAKWQQVSLHLPTGLNNSCYHPPLHEIDAQVVEFHPSALHNTQHKKEQRKIKKTPAVTIVAACINAETGVGPSIASGNQVCNNN